MYDNGVGRGRREMDPGGREAGGGKVTRYIGKTSGETRRV